METKPQDGGGCPLSNARPNLRMRTLPPAPGTGRDPRKRFWQNAGGKQISERIVNVDMTRSGKDRARDTLRLPVRDRPCRVLARSLLCRVTFAGAWLAPCVILVSCGTLDLTRSGRRAAANREAMNRDFVTAPAAYRVMQYSMGRGVDLDTAKRHGLGGLVCAVRGDAYYKGDYLRDESEWTRLTNQVAEVLNRGLKIWLFDERGYPSGGAGDLVVEEDSRHVNLGVFQIWIDGTGIVDRTSIELPDEAYRFVGSSIRQRTESGALRSKGGSGVVSRYAISTHGMSGSWRFSAFVLRPVVEGTHAAMVGPTFGWKGLYPNLLDRDAVAKFIEITHEAYAQRLGPDAMRRVEAIYSNEPSLKPHWFPPGARPSGEAYVPWVSGLPQTFRAMHGYDLIPRMGELFDPATNVYSRVRLHFYQTVGEIMAESFAGQIAEWCRRHGILFTGHLLSEELMCYHPPLYGDFFKQIQSFDLPGADMPILKPEDPAAGRFIGVRFVSSAARAIGKRHVQTLMDPILGKWKDEQGRMTSVPVDSLLRSVNLLFYNGVNHMTIYGPWDEYPPEEYEQFNLYTGRLAALLREAVNDARVAVYYPIESFQARYRPTPNTIWSEQREYWDLQSSVWNLERLCHDNSIDHNFVNAEAVRAATVARGAMSIGDHDYRVLLMPAMGIVPLDVLETIRRFEAAGGRVVWTGLIPALGAVEREDERVVSLLEGVEAVTDRNEILRATRAVVPTDLSFETDSDAGRRVLVSKYDRAGLALLLVINDAVEAVTLRDVQCRSATRCGLYDPSTGARTELGPGDAVTINPRRAVVLAFDASEMCSRAP